MSNSKNKITSSSSFNDCFDELTILNEAAVRPTTTPVLYVDLSPSNTDDGALSLINDYISKFEHKAAAVTIKYFTDHVYDFPQKALAMGEPADYSEVLIDIVNNGYNNVYILTDADIENYPNHIVYQMLKSTINLVYVDDLDKNRKLANMQSRQRIRYEL